MQAAIDQNRMSGGQMHSWLNNRIAVYWGVALASVLLSLYRIAGKDLINGDGILYIRVAQAFLNEGAGAAFGIYHWPLYPFLIGLLHSITGLSLENSAGILNTLFMMLACVFFVRIYEEISGREARIWVAAALVLALPVLNDYRELVIRGFGFWAFMLIAVYCFIQYSRSPGLMNALKWQLAILVATLFRVEGAAFIVFAPFFFLSIAGERRRLPGHLVRLNGLFLLLAVGAVPLLLLSGAVSLPASMEIPYQLEYFSPAALLGAINTEAAAFFARNRFMASVGEARLILLAGVVALVMVKVASNAGLAFLAVWGYGIRQKWFRLTRESGMVLYFAAIGFLSLVAVAGNFFFVSSRYTVLTVLLLSLISFQYVDYLFRDLSRRRLYKWNAAAGVFILVLFLDGVISGSSSKLAIREAGNWAASGITAEEKVACNEARLEFYSADRCAWVRLAETDPAAAMPVIKDEGYTHVLFWIDRKNAGLRKLLEGDPALLLEKEFPGIKGNTVRLYRIVPEAG